MPVSLGRGVIRRPPGGGRSGEARGLADSTLSWGSDSDLMSDADAVENFHPELKSGCFGGERASWDFWGTEGRGGVRTTMSGWEGGNHDSLGGDLGGGLGGLGDIRLDELRPSLDRVALGGSEGGLGVFLRLCVLCRTGVCFDDDW